MVQYSPRRLNNALLQADRNIFPNANDRKIINHHFIRSLFITFLDNIIDTT